jgi:hypothetical protein
MKVDPSALAAAAQRIAAALTDLVGGDPLHPALAADGASTGAATRLSTAAATLAALLDAQVAALAGTATQLGAVATGFTEQEALNAASVASLSSAVRDAGMSGFAPPPPAATPDVRPPMPPPAKLPGQVIASALSAGTPDAGQGFIAGWTRLAAAVEDAAALLRRSAAELPEVWDSEVSTDVVRDHLIGHADALGGTAARTHGIVRQASAHAEQYGQAVADTPSPEEFAAINQQLQLAIRQNAMSGGKLAGAVAALSAKRSGLETQAQQAYSEYHYATDATTASDPSAAGADPGQGRDGAPGGAKAPGADAAARDGAMSPDKAGQMASMLPQMIPTVLGAAGGLVGGAVSMVGQIPQALMQAGEQLAGTAAQGLSGMGGAGKDEAAKKLDLLDGGQTTPGDAGAGSADGGGGGDATVPASGSTPPAPVMPSTGALPTLPTTPQGGLPPPPQPAPPATSGGMPMGMPLSGMMGPGGAGAAAGERATRPKKLVVPPEPHTESVTGKVTDRITSAAAAVGGKPAEPHLHPDPPDDDPPPRLVVRRIKLGESDE